MPRYRKADYVEAALSGRICVYCGQPVKDSSKEQMVMDNGSGFCHKPGVNRRCDKLYRVYLVSDYASIAEWQAARSTHAEIKLSRRR